MSTFDELRKQTACFTGHRQIPFLKRHRIKSDLRKTVIQCIGQGYRYFGAGGALGFDTVAARTILELKKTYPEIKLILVLPCPSQASKWDKADIAEYERIKQSADKVVYTSQEFNRGCMHKRNRHLVDNSSLCIAYLTETTGGTAYTVDYAKSNGLTIINLADRV